MIGDAIAMLLATILAPSSDDVGAFVVVLPYRLRISVLDAWASVTHVRYKQKSCRMELITVARMVVDDVAELFACIFFFHYKYSRYVLNDIIFEICLFSFLSLSKHMSLPLSFLFFLHCFLSPCCYFYDGFYIKLFLVSTSNFWLVVIIL